MNLQILTLLTVATALALAAEPELPPCPTNFQFLPQNLPMHCRMTRSISGGGSQSKPDAPFSSFPNMQMPMNMGSFPMSGQMSSGTIQSDGQAQPLPPFPGPPGMPPAMPMPAMPPVPMPGPAHKVPVIVMPFYSPDQSVKSNKRKESRKKWKRPIYSERDSSGSDSSLDDSSSADGGYWRGRSGRRSGNKHSVRHRKHKHSASSGKKSQLLTPVLQYVTKEGYVIFEKKISNNEATDWLKMKENKPQEKTTRKPSTTTEHDSDSGDDSDNEPVTERRTKNAISHDAILNEFHDDDTLKRKRKAYKSKPSTKEKPTKTEKF